MSPSPSELKSGKGHKDENFPVASRLIQPRHRPAILAFYRFVRAADDVADHATLSADEKLRLLDGMDAALTGDGPADPEAEPLRLILEQRGLSARHARDLLDAFRLDARKTRYADWSELLHYCSLSAVPVGRFVLDVHGEDERTWRASDPLCAALQVINHLQDCGKDFREIDRVYIPAETFARHGASPEDLGRDHASPGLLAAIRELNGRCRALLAESHGFPGLVRDRRLGLEVAVINTLAESLVGKLAVLDPLADRVHASKGEALGSVMAGLFRGLWQRRPGAVPIAAEPSR